MSEIEPGAYAKGHVVDIMMLTGLQTYEPIWLAMKDYALNRGSEDSDQFWVLQHFPVYTQGQAGKPEHILDLGETPLVAVDRGGQVTYHGPGQLVVYVLVDLDRLGIGPRVLVSLIEYSITKVLGEIGIDAYPKSDAPGVYVGDSKIASLGLRIKKGRSYHGLSVNVDMDLAPFKGINPCGYVDMNMIQTSDLNREESIDQIAARLCRALVEAFGYDDMIINFCEEIAHQ